MRNLPTAFRNPIVVACLAITTFGCAKNDTTTSKNENSMGNTTQQPPMEAPDGFRWELLTSHSDEFDGPSLDTTKWRNHFRGWAGRAPGKFLPESVSVADGHLRIRVHTLETPQGEDDKFTIGCGAVQSLEPTPLYGYYECRMKASSCSTSSTFWLKTYHTPKDRPYVSTELDIVECIGNAQKWPSFATQMISNTHVALHPKVTPPKTTAKGLSQKMLSEKPPSESMKGRADLGGRVNEAFHTYGCWWRDANRLDFYLDGKFAFTIDAPNKVAEHPFNQPMFLNMVCEVYDWEVAPLPANLADDTKNTTLYDYVRSYRLVPID